MTNAEPNEPEPTLANRLAFTQSDRLDKALRVAEVSTQEMADYLGVSRYTISNYTAGRTEPRLQTLRLWAMRCGVPLEWIMTGDIANPPGPMGKGGGSLPDLDSNQEPAGFKPNAHSARVISIHRDASLHAA